MGEAELDTVDEDGLGEDWDARGWSPTKSGWQVVVRSSQPNHARRENTEGVVTREALGTSLAALQRLFARSVVGGRRGRAARERAVRAAAAVRRSVASAVSWSPDTWRQVRSRPEGRRGPG